MNGKKNGCIACCGGCCILVVLFVILTAGPAFMRGCNRARKQITAEKSHIEKGKQIQKDSLASPERDKPFLERRASFQTDLNRKDKPPFVWKTDSLPRELELVTYESNGLKLKAALYVPPNLGNKKRPALVFCHRSFTLLYADIQLCRPFLDDDFIVMMPMLRGENGGEGHYELLVGEVDDAANAVRWLSRHRNVDADNIYAFGQHIGGSVSVMLSLMDGNLPLRHSGSSNGLFTIDVFYRWKNTTTEGVEIIRFDPEDINECLMRVLQGNVKWMNRKHYAYIGSQDKLLDGIQTEAASVLGEPRLITVPMSNDLMADDEAAVKQYHAVVMADVRRGGISDRTSSPSVPTVPPVSVTGQQPPEESPPQQSAASILGSLTGRSSPQTTSQTTTDDAPPPSTGQSRETDRVGDELGTSVGDVFSEPVPDHGDLVGFEISMGGRDDSDIMSVQPLYRAKDGSSQGKGKLYGQKSDKVERAFAPRGYAVGAIRGKEAGNVKGFELIFMKIREDGTLDASGTQTSPWLGAKVPETSQNTIIDGKGRQVTAISGSIFMGGVNSIKLEFE